MSQLGNLDGFERSLRAVYGAFDIEPIDLSARSRGGMSPLALGPFQGFGIRAQAVRSIRPALKGDWADQAFILFSVSGDVKVHHYDRTVALATGDIVLMDSHEPCTIDVSDGTQSVVLAMPRDTLTQMRPNADRLYGRQIAGQRGAGRMLAAVLRSLQDDEADAAGGSAGDRAIAMSVTMTLLEGALNAAGAAEGGLPDRAAQQIERMREWVTPRIGDPALDADLLADQFGLSRRSLYRLFSEAGTTPHRWLANLRLDLAQHWLKDAASPHRSVCQVAYAAGFNDSSHFARLFKRRFGTSPARLRPKGN
jgi:AraC family transcriptional regulator, positive regulator of tynA and feaB